MRYLVCTDDPMPENGACQNEVWVQVPTWVQYLPTIDQAVEVGGAFWGSLIILAAAKRLLKPPRNL